MTAPERFADSQIPLAPRAPSIHDPYETWGCRFVGPLVNKIHRLLRRQTKPNQVILLFYGGAARPPQSGRPANEEDTMAKKAKKAKAKKTKKAKAKK